MVLKCDTLWSQDTTRWRAGEDNTRASYFFAPRPTGSSTLRTAECATRYHRVSAKEAQGNCALEVQLTRYRRAVLLCQLRETTRG